MISHEGIIAAAASQPLQVQSGFCFGRAVLALRVRHA